MRYFEKCAANAYTKFMKNLYKTSPKIFSDLIESDLKAFKTYMKNWTGHTASANISKAKTLGRLDEREAALHLGIAAESIKAGKRLKRQLSLMKDYNTRRN